MNLKPILITLGAVCLGITGGVAYWIDAGNAKGVPVAESFSGTEVQRESSSPLPARRLFHPQAQGQPTGSTKLVELNPRRRAEVEGGATIARASGGGVNGGSEIAPFRGTIGLTGTTEAATVAMQKRTSPPVGEAAPGLGATGPMAMVNVAVFSAARVTPVQTKPVPIPTLLEDANTETKPVTPRQAAEIAQIQQDFADRIGGPGQDANDPDYLARWLLAQRLSEQEGEIVLGSVFMDHYRSVLASREAARR